MKKLFLMLAGVGMLSSASAQNGTPSSTLLNSHPRCLFDEVLQRAGVSYSQLAGAYRQAAASDSNGAAAKNATVTYDIPVVFHVVYNAAQPAYNIPDYVLFNQLQILNDAFRKRHADTGKTRPFFKPVSADAQIQFHLATQDPFGVPTTGITRTVSPLLYFGSSMGGHDSLERVKSTAAGGIDPWPTDRYYNIWVCDMADDQGQLSVLGYGTPPLNPLPGNWLPGVDTLLLGMKDGVVMQTQAVGSNNPLGADVSMTSTRGRVLVHETGHYLGLAHTFGLTTGMCGTPEQSDGIYDTPEESEVSFSIGAPNPLKNSCYSLGPVDSVDMWENYMDYTVDSFQTLFTNDQVALMRMVAGFQRSTLATPTSVTTVSQDEALMLYPNPASSVIWVKNAGPIKQATVLNIQGNQVVVLNGREAATAQYDVSQLGSGTYFLLLELADGSYRRGRFVISR